MAVESLTVINCPLASHCPATDYLSAGTTFSLLGHRTLAAAEAEV